MLAGLAGWARKAQAAWGWANRGSHLPASPAQQRLAPPLHLCAHSLLTRRRATLRPAACSYRRLVYRAFRGQGMNAAQIKREAAGRAASAAV